MASMRMLFYGLVVIAGFVIGLDALRDRQALQAAAVPAAQAGARSYVNEADRRNPRTRELFVYLQLGLGGAMMLGGLAGVIGAVARR
jgi:hypothetical protein